MASSHHSNRGVSKNVYKGVEISCAMGNIVESQCEGICISCDSHYTIRTGVGKAVMNAGGEGFIRNLEQAKAGGRGGPIAVAAAGNLRCRQVILIPIRNSDRSTMHLIYGQLLYKVAEQRLVTVAVPALGTGGYGLSPRRVSVDMRDALACTPSFGSLKSIQFMDLNAQAMQEFDLSIQELVDPSRQRRNQSTGQVENSEEGPGGSRSGQGHYIQVEASELLQLRKSKQKPDGSCEEMTCSICISEMGGEDTSSVVLLSECPHMFHEDCINLAFKTKAQCPLCMKWYSAAEGNQPLGSTMNVRVVQGSDHV